MRFGMKFLGATAWIGAFVALCSLCVAEVLRDSMRPFVPQSPIPTALQNARRGFDSAPSVTVSRGGRLWIAWHAGGTTEGEDNAALVATSGDGGKSWSQPLFALDAPGPLRALDPGLWTDPSGKVWLFYAQIYSFWDGRGGVWAMSPEDPERADTRWSAPRRLCDGFLKNKPIELRDGRWLLPVEFMNSNPISGFLGQMKPMTGPEAHPSPEMMGANVFESRDCGQTVGFLGKGEIPKKDRNCTENMVYERRDGTLRQLVRTSYGIGESLSRDGGRTWTDVSPSNIKNPASRFYIGRLRSGALLLVKNGPVDRQTDRREITAFVSDDDGETWTGGLVLDPRRDVSYPDAAEDGDGRIHVVNDHERTGAREIMHHVFTEADVRAGKIVSRGSRLGDVVTAAPKAEKRSYDVAAYVWPAYQPEPRWAELGIFEKGIGEWQNVQEARPKWPGHRQPMEPLWGYENEADPKVVAKKIDAASAAGVNVFIYDWYWYGGRPFLENALNEGFLKAPNRDKMKFFVMWANHHVDRIWDNKAADKQGDKPIWRGWVSAEEFRTLVPRWIDKYFREPNYYRIQGRPVFMIYNLEIFIEGVGGEAKAVEALEFLRAACREAGLGGVHLMTCDRRGLRNEWIEKLGIDSASTYTFRMWSDPAGNKDYAPWAAKAMERFDAAKAELKGLKAYFAHACAGWDTNPRFPASVKMATAVNATPAKFEQVLRRAKDWCDRNTPAGFPHLITLNSWNEWTEGAVLEPSVEFGFGYLEAVRRVFRPEAAGASAQ